MKPKKKNLQKNEQGLVSMIVVIFVMLLLTLIVLSMSRSANQERRQALDRQLNSQAFYAAESGVNDAVDYVAAKMNANEEVVSKEECGPLRNPDYDNVLETQGPVEYSCLLYDVNPDSLQYGPIQVDKSEIVPIQSSRDIQSLTISWDEEGGTGRFGSCNAMSTTQFPSVLDYPKAECSAGVVRVDLIDARDLDREALARNNFVAFFVPGVNSGSSITHASAVGATNQGRVVSAHCNDANTPRKCKSTITGIGLNAGHRMYLKIRSLYTRNNVTITGSDTSGGVIEFERAQLMVDSTGKANDVLKRIQVRVPLQQKFDYPEFAIQTADSICKLLSVTPQNTTIDSSCNPN